MLPENVNCNACFQKNRKRYKREPRNKITCGKCEKNSAKQETSIK